MKVFYLKIPMTSIVKLFSELSIDIHSYHSCKQRKVVCSMKYRIEWEYQLKGKDPILFSSDWVEGDTVLQLHEDIMKTGRVKQITFFDEFGTGWKEDELRKLFIEIEKEPHDITIYFDGGYNKETKQAALGVVIYYTEDKKNYRIRANGLVSELTSNNEAECAALAYAINILEEIEIHHIPVEVRGDSQVVLKQLEGEWACYDEVTNRWLDQIEEKMGKLGIKPTYVPISRKENKEADKLASQAFDGIEIHSRNQIASKQ